MGTDASLLMGMKRCALKHLLPRAPAGFPPDLLAAVQIRPLIRHPKYKTEASIEPCWALHDWPVHILQNIMQHCCCPAALQVCRIWPGLPVWRQVRLLLGAQADAYAPCPDPSNCLHFSRRCKFIHPHDLPAMAGASPAGAVNTAAPSAQLPGLASPDGSAAAVTAGPDRSVLCFVRDSSGH